MSTEELFGTVGIALDWVGDVFLKMDNISDNPSSVDDLFGTNLVKKIIDLGHGGRLTDKTKEEIIETVKRDFIEDLCERMDIDSLETLEEFLVGRDVDTEEINEVAKQLEPYLEFELIEADILNDVVKATQDDVLIDSALATVEENVEDEEDEFEEEDLDELNKSQLKVILDSYGLSKTGTKKELIKRIEKHRRAAVEDVVEIEVITEEEGHYEIGDIEDALLQFDEDDDEDDEHVHDENCMHEHEHEEEFEGEYHHMEEIHVSPPCEVEKGDTFVEQVRMWSLLAEFWNDDINMEEHIEQHTTGQLLFDRMTKLMDSGKISTKAEFFTGIGLLFSMKPQDVVKLFTLLEKLE